MGQGANLGIGDLVGGVLRGRVMPERVVRLGVTGLSRAGKTVFITNLVANLLARGRMPALSARDRIEAVYLHPQPDMTLPRFAYEEHLAAMTGDYQHWPQSTRAVSELRLSFRVRGRGLLGVLGPQVVHLDIVDYPGEWLLDLGLLDKSYQDWSEAVLARLSKRDEGAGYLALARAEDGALPLDEPRAAALARAFTAYLQAARQAGLSDCTPGRFLLPGDLAGAPALTFAPLPKPASLPKGCQWSAMQARFEAYKAQIIRPFFRDHFAKIDRQIVLVDVMDAVHRGPTALEDLRRTLAEVLGAFLPGKRGWLDRIMGTKRVERILFAATKADHLHHHQHPNLTALTEALLDEAKARADFAGAKTAALSLASLRCTVEDEIPRDGALLDGVRGRLADGRRIALYPGELPSDPARLLAPAREGATRWLNADFALMAFEPARFAARAGAGPPHIRLDRAAEFLFGDLL
jgi:predicted YcjX-like family ATPase